MTLAVRCHNLTKSFPSASGPVTVLRGIDLDVYAGELLILSGPSGCGKTTLISIIAGILSPTSGGCEIYGTSLPTLSHAALCAFRSQTIGFVFQAYNLLPTLSACQNVGIPLMIQGYSLRAAEEAGREMMAKVGLQEYTNAYASTLSGGQQQRVAIARALIHNPKLIVCDEPTSALDGENGLKVMTLLKGLALQEQRALIVVTHDSRTYSFADRIAKMEDGRILDVTSSPREL